MINWFVIRFFSILGISLSLSLSLIYDIFGWKKREENREGSRWKVVGEVHGERVERRWLEIRLTSPTTSQGEMVLLTYRTWALDLPLYSIPPMCIFSKLDLTVGGFHENLNQKIKLIILAKRDIVNLLYYQWLSHNFHWKRVYLCKFPFYQIDQIPMHVNSINMENFHFHLLKTIKKNTKYLSWNCKYSFKSQFSVFGILIVWFSRHHKIYVSLNFFWIWKLKIIIKKWERGRECDDNHTYFQVLNVDFFSLVF